MKRAIDLVADEIRPRLLEYFPELKGCPGLTFRIADRCFPSLHTNASFPPKGWCGRQIFKVVLESTSTKLVKRTLFVKVHQNYLTAADEFRKLQIAWKHFETSNDFEVSKPIDLIKGVNAVVTAGVEGVCLNDLVLWAKVMPPTQGRTLTLARQMKRTAGWLRFLHSIDVEDISLDREDFVCGYEALIKRAVSSGLPGHLVSKAWSMIDIIRQYEWASKPALIHYAFCPDHVFLSESRVSAVDFEGLQIGPAFLDLATFYCSIELMVPELMVPELMVPQLGNGTLRHMVRSIFLQSGRNEAGSKVANAFCALELLRQWVYFVELLHGSKTPHLLAALVARKALASIQSLSNDT